MAKQPNRIALHFIFSELWSGISYNLRLINSKGKIVRELKSDTVVVDDQLERLIKDLEGLIDDDDITASKYVDGRFVRKHYRRFKRFKEIGNG